MVVRKRPSSVEAFITGMEPAAEPLVAPLEEPVAEPASATEVEPAVELRVEMSTENTVECKAETASEQSTDRERAARRERGTVLKATGIQLVNVRLDVDLLYQIDYAVQCRRPMLRRHQWILEAICEKLDREGNRSLLA